MYTDYCKYILNAPIHFQSHRFSDDSHRNRTIYESQTHSRQQYWPVAMIKYVCTAEWSGDKTINSHSHCVLSVLDFLRAFSQEIPSLSSSQKFNNHMNLLKGLLTYGCFHASSPSQQSSFFVLVQRVKTSHHSCRSISCKISIFLFAWSMFG